MNVVSAHMIYWKVMKRTRGNGKYCLSLKKRKQQKEQRSQTTRILFESHLEIDKLKKKVRVLFTDTWVLNRYLSTHIHRIYYMYHGFEVYKASISARGEAEGWYLGARVVYSPYTPRSHDIYITYIPLGEGVRSLFLTAPVLLILLPVVRQSSTEDERCLKCVRVDFCCVTFCDDPLLTWLRFEWFLINAGELHVHVSNV